MRIFLSYAYTGESPEQVEARLVAVRDILLQNGHEVYCFHFDPVRTDDMPESECIARALERMIDYESVLVINTSERRSEGMLVEVGAALARSKKVVYAQHQSSVGKSYAPSLADYTFIWRTEGELLARTVEYFGGLSDAPFVQKGPYRHAKSGKLYEVKGVAFHTETDEWLVVYKPNYPCEIKLFVRPVGMFFETVVIDSITRQRFEYLGE